MDEFGSDRIVVDIQPTDFAALRASVAVRLGPVALGNFIQRIRTVFKYGFDAGLLDVPVRYGPGFCKPSRRVVRLERAKLGARVIDAVAVRKLVKLADVQLRAMILLGVNCGLGQGDCSELPRSALLTADLNAGVEYGEAPRLQLQGRGRRVLLGRRAGLSVRHQQQGDQGDLVVRPDGRRSGEPPPREGGHRGDQFGPDPPPELEPAEEAAEPAGGHLGGGRLARPPIPGDELRTCPGRSRDHRIGPAPNAERRNSQA